MIELGAARVAEEAGGELRSGDPAGPGPRRAVVDTRALRPGDLFVGLRGKHVDGGAHAREALAAGAWGVLVAPEHAPVGRSGARAGEERSPIADRASTAAMSSGRAPDHASGTVITAGDPLAALQKLARGWRRELGCRVVGITGSTGKTSTKDILAGLLRPQVPTYASRENLNTEIGLPLSLLEAPSGTEVVVLEMAMRGEGQIAELTAIAEPDVGVIVNVGAVHLALLHTVERVAAAKAELIRDLRPGAACVLPAREPLLEGHRRDDLDTWSFGPGGQVQLLSYTSGRAEIEARGERVELDLPYAEPHNLLNTLAAVAAARALGVAVGGRVEVRFSSLRGQVVELPGGVVVVNDCYNANPMSMRAALDHLAGSPAERRIAVLGTMAELGEGSEEFHRSIGEHAAARGIDVLVPVGREALGYAEGFHGELHPVASPEEAAALLEEVARPGDRVLVKGSRSAGLERVLAVS